MCGRPGKCKQNLSFGEHGIEKIRDMIIDDIKSSLKDKNTMHASESIFVLNSFLKKYPEAKLDDNQ